MGFNQILGLIVIAFGLYSSFQRIYGSEKILKKLEDMKASLGPKTGSVVHTVGYCILPIVCGLILWTS